MNITILANGDPHIQNTFFTARAMDELNRLGNVKCAVMSRGEAMDSVGDTDVLLGSWGFPRQDAEFLDRAPKLGLIAYTGGSVADIMTDEVPRRGIRFLCGNRLYAQSVAEGTIGYMLLSQRRLPKIMRSMRETGWAPDIDTDGIRYKTVGLLGYGMIVKELLPLLKPFRCTVKVCSDYFTAEDAERYGAVKCDAEEIFSTCDIVSLHESLRADTWHWIDRRFFSMMKENALFINTARGPIIVEEDLAEACASRNLRAVLDVYEEEPLPMHSCLRGQENILLIPHRGGPTTDVREQVTLSLIRDIRTWINDPAAALETEIDASYAGHMTRSADLLKKELVKP